jgi:translation initiation factor eIF-2B subunit epsilon
MDEPDSFFGRRVERVTSNSSTTSLPENTSEAEFLSECVQSLQRAFVEGHSVDNAAVELKTLRMASNVPLRRVREVVIGFIVDKIPLDKDAATQKRELLQVTKRWGKLVLAIGGANGAETVAILQVTWSQHIAYMQTLMNDHRNTVLPGICESLYSRLC